MAETVFILGAGASSEAGAPLMVDFLDEAQRLSKSGGIPLGDVQLVLEARNHLRAAHSNTAIDFRNLESLFAAFEMASLLGRLGTMNVEVVKQLPSAMERLIAQTLGASIALTLGPEGEGLEPPAAFKAFAELVGLIRRKEPQGVVPVSVLTFNYDTCLDHALYQAGLNPNYCLDEGPDDGVSLLKLHGSLNWVYCDQCQKVTWWSIGKHLATRRFHRDEIEDLGSKGIPLSKFLGAHYEYVCKHSRPCKPLIVPPTYNKGHRYTDIAHVWRTAAAELSQAENIYVMGFSLPETDQFFRYFCAVGMLGDAYLRRFWVFDPDREGVVEARFRDWLGQETKQVFQKHDATFSKAVEMLCGELR